jgi:hypothetical protein
MCRVGRCAGRSGAARNPPPRTWVDAPSSVRRRRVAGPARMAAGASAAPMCSGQWFPDGCQAGGVALRCRAEIIRQRSYPCLRSGQCPRQVHGLHIGGFFSSPLLPREFTELPQPLSGRSFWQTPATFASIRQPAPWPLTHVVLRAAGAPGFVGWL